MSRPVTSVGTLVMTQTNLAYIILFSSAGFFRSAQCLAMGLCICSHAHLGSYQYDSRDGPFMALSPLARRLSWAHPSRFMGVSLSSGFFLTSNTAPYQVISFSTPFFHPLHNPIPTDPLQSITWADSNSIPILILLFLPQNLKDIVTTIWISLRTSSRMAN